MYKSISFSNHVGTVGDVGDNYYAHVYMCDDLSMHDTFHTPLVVLFAITVETFVGAH